MFHHEATIDTQLEPASMNGAYHLQSQNVMASNADCCTSSMHSVLASILRSAELLHTQGDARRAGAHGFQKQIINNCPRLIGSCLDVASPTRGRIAAAFNCSLSAGCTLPLNREIM